MNQAYYFGAQNLAADGNALRKPRIGLRSREFFSANYVIVKVTKAIARLIALVPDMEAPPRSSSFEDLLASQLASQLFEHLKDVTGFSTGLRRVLLWAALCGSGFKKVYFDEHSGEVERIWHDSTNTPILQADADTDLQRALEENGQFTDEFKGEVRSQVLSPFHVKQDPMARSGGFDEAAWVMVDYFTSPENLNDEFGEHEWAYEGADQARMWEDNIAFFSTSEGFTMGRGSAATKSLCRRTEYWERPLPRNGMKGRFIVRAGGHIVWNGDNPYAKAKIGLPFVKYDWFPAEGRFLGVSLVDQIRRSQKAYNRARSNTIEFMQTYAWPPVFLPKQSQVKPVSMVGFPGTVWEYNAQGGQKPEFGQSPRMSETIPLAQEAAKSEMDEISAQASPAKEAYPSQVRSGAAISLVQQDNSAILTPISHAMFETIAREGEMMLALVDTFYSKGRTMTAMNDAGEFEVSEFRGSDLRHHKKLRVRGRPGMVESPEAYRQNVLDSVQVGALQPAQNARDRALFFRAMQLKTDTELLDLETKQVARERLTIRRCIRDVMYFPPHFEETPWEDPMVRLPVLEHFLNSSTFETLDDLSKKKLVGRYQEMTQVLAQRMQAQMQMQEQAAGSPGQKGVASQPAR